MNKNLKQEKSLRPQTQIINNQLEKLGPVQSDSIAQPSLSPRAIEINQMLEENPPILPVYPGVITTADLPIDKEKKEKQEQTAKQFRVDLNR